MKGILRGSVAGRKRCNKVETVREFAYQGGRVSVDGGCEAAVTTRK